MHYRQRKLNFVLSTPCSLLGPDVQCEEVCVFCFKVFRIASEYIRHTRDHSDAIEEKVAYTKRRCHNLIATADEELGAYLPKDPDTRAKKRTWAEASLDTDEQSDALRNVVTQPQVTKSDPKAGQLNHSETGAKKMWKKTSCLKRNIQKPTQKFHPEMEPYLVQDTNPGPKNTWGDAVIGPCTGSTTMVVHGPTNDNSPFKHSGFVDIETTMPPNLRLSESAPTSVPLVSMAKQTDFVSMPIQSQSQADITIPLQDDDDMYTPDLFFRMNFPPSADPRMNLTQLAGVATMELQHTG